MICLGIESTAHTFGVGIVDENCNVFANEKDTFKTLKGGMIPREVFDHHVNHASRVIESALKKANLTINNIDVVSYSVGPGMGQILQVGQSVARLFELFHSKEIQAVNHCIAHVEIGKKITNAFDPIIVYASGGSTQIIGLNEKRYRVYGETLDIGIGNFLDSFGRELGFGFPAGPMLDERYFNSKEYIKLPYTVKGMDLFFSGLLTFISQKIGQENEDALIYSALHTAFAMLTEVTERALAHTSKKEVLLCGGVAASKALQKMMQKMCDQRNIKLFVTPVEYTVDNGAMIAWQGILQSKSKIKQRFEKVQPKQRIDYIEVKW